MLAVAAALEVGYFHVWRLGVLAGYRRIDFEESPPTMEVFGEWFSWLFEFGLIHAAVLIGLAHVGFFRVREAPNFRIRRAMLMIPIFMGIHMFQLMVASATSSTGL